VAQPAPDAAFVGLHQFREHKVVAGIRVYTLAARLQAHPGELHVTHRQSGYLAAGVAYVTIRALAAGVPW
jgi:hypothetical protein